MKVLVHSAGAVVEADVAALGGVGVATVDFGAGASDASVVVTGQTGILSGSSVSAQLTAVATATHSADEHVAESPQVCAGGIVPGASFTIYVKTNNKAITGTWSVAWSWS